MSNLSATSESRSRTASPKVAMVAPSMAILGGQGVQARSLQEALARESVDIEFVPINPQFPAPLAWVRRIPGLRTVLNELLYIPSLLRLRKVEVVHIFSASYWSFLLAPVPAILIARLLGKEAILNYHSGEARDHLANWGLLVHPFLKLVDRLVVPSTYLQEVFADFGYEAEVVANIVDVQQFRFRAREPLRPVLFSNRNLESHYCVENTLRAFAELKKLRPEARLLVAGYGSQAESLHELASELQLEDVEFLGRIEAEEMADCYARADIFVNSSLVDNQPLSILEAFAAGLAVVSTPTGDIPAMVRQGELGVLVPHREPQTMAREIDRLLEDQAATQARIRAARKEVDKYTWLEIASQWFEIYKKS